MGASQFLTYLHVSPAAAAVALILALVGLFLIAGAVVCFVSPGPGALTMSSAGLIVLGLWNVGFVFLLAAIARQVGAYQIMWGVIGVWQVIWGIRMLGPKSRHAAIALARPAPEALRQLDAMAAAVKRAREKSGGEFVEFTASSPQAMMMRGRLMPEWALFSDHSGTHLYFATPSDVELRLSKEGPLKKRNKCELVIRGERMLCSVPELSFQRIQAWQAGPPASPAAAAVPASIV